jgi:WD40 repeat protein
MPRCQVHRNEKLEPFRKGRYCGLDLGHTDHVDAVPITPAGRYAVSAGQDCALKVWELPGGRELATLTGHTDAVGIFSRSWSRRCGGGGESAPRS